MVGFCMKRALLWLAPLAFTALFFFYPLWRILTLSFRPDTLNAANLQIAARVSAFTFYQALLSTFLTFLVGVPGAVLFARYRFAGQSLLRALTAVPFMLPTVVVAAGFNALLGGRGWVNLLLMHLFGWSTPPLAFTGTLSAILLAHVFYNTTIVIRILGNALSHLDPRLEQAARSLGAGPLQVWQHLHLPLLGPALLSASLLVFLFDFTSFGVILLLGGPRFATLEVEIYIQALQLLNLPLAALLTLIQLACTLLFTILYTRLATGTAVQSLPRPAESNLRRPRTPAERGFVILGSALLLGLLVAPMLALPLRSVARLEAERGERSPLRAGLTVDYYRELFINRRGSLFYVPPFRAVLNSLGYAGATILLSFLMGLPAAFALARPTRLERILDPILMLPLGASSVTLGLGFIVAFNRPLPPLSDRAVVTLPPILPLAHTLVALPFVIRTLQPALASIPQRLRQAAASLGASPFRVWQTVDWPILRRATLAAMTFAFTISLGEFGATALLARPEYPTIPIAIYRFLSQPGALNFGQAMAMATLLMTLTALGVFLIEKLRLPGTGEF